MQRLQYRTYTSNDSWTAPAGVTQAIIFGRGGSAGGSGTGTIGTMYVPGGGGCYTTMQFVNVVPNTTYSITIGTAGAGGTGTNGSIGLGTGGGDTTFGSLATFKGAAAATSFSPSHGLTVGGWFSVNEHHLVGGQKSPFANGGTGVVTGVGGRYYGGGGGGDGAGGNASSGGNGSSGVNGGGGGSGNLTGGAGTTGQCIVAWWE